MEIYVCVCERLAGARWSQRVRVSVPVVVVPLVVKCVIVVVMWPGIDPGTASRHHPPTLNGQLNSGPSTPVPSSHCLLEGSHLATSLATFSLSLPPVSKPYTLAITLWSSSLSACTNKACIRSVRVCKGLKRACGTVRKWKRMTSKGA